MKQFIIYWLDGNKETIYGKTITEAMKNAGIGAGAVPAIDFWADAESTNKYKYSHKLHCWVGTT